MGRVDIYHSRRTNYHKCFFWIRNERRQVADLNQLVYKDKPSGSFYARETTPITNQENIVQGAWLGDRNFITIVTDDDIEDLTRGSVVKYKDKLWMVDSVQSKEHTKESEFSKKSHYTYYINLRS